MASGDVTFRTATPDDCAVILHHRRSMFEDMKEGSAQDLDQMLEATRPWLERALADGSYRGWLAAIAGGRFRRGRRVREILAPGAP